jgi:hypothetical protein
MKFKELKAQSFFIKICVALLITMSFYGCNSDEEDEDNTVVDPVTTYYISYLLNDTSYNFTSTNPNRMFGTSEIICRIGYPDDFYSGIEITFTNVDNSLLTFSDIEALENTYVPLNYSSNDYSGVVAKIETLTPDTYYSINVDSVDQHGWLFIEQVDLLPSKPQSPTSKMAKVKGQFECNMWPDSARITDGEFLINFSFWIED